MPLSGFAPKSSESKGAIVGTFLVANAFIWYFSAFKFVQSDFLGTPQIEVISVGLASLVLTAFGFTLQMGRLKSRLEFLKYWVLAGLLLSLSFVFLDFKNLASCTFISGVLGVYFGLGMPTCMGYFSAGVKPERRAKSAAVVILLIGFGFPLFSLIDISQTYLVAISLSAWRFLALCSLLVFKPPELSAEPKNTTSYRSVVGNKTFLLYFVPWFMFVLINELAKQINAGFFNGLPAAFANNNQLVEVVVSGVSAVACGIVADKRGRKRIALVGFALLGLGYAVLGIFNQDAALAYSAAWFYTIADGIAWGAFSTLFLITIWGDIAQEKNSEKFYFIGVVPYLIANMAGTAMGTLISASISSLSTGNEVSTVFSFASFFLFIAILPLAYAPETLSDKIITSLDINDYVNKALKKANKEIPTKQQKTTEAAQEDGDDEAPDESREAAEAEKLAEKYCY